MKQVFLALAFAALAFGQGSDVVVISNVSATPPVPYAPGPPLNVGQSYTVSYDITAIFDYDGTPTIKLMAALKDGSTDLSSQMGSPSVTNQSIKKIGTITWQYTATLTYEYTPAAAQGGHTLTNEVDFDFGPQGGPYTRISTSSTMDVNQP